MKSLLPKFDRTWLLILVILAFVACTDTTPPPPGQDNGAPEVAIQPEPQASNSTEPWICSTKPAEPDNRRAVGPKTKFWPTGQVFRVGFLGGTAQQRQYPIDAFTEWSKYANVNFVYPTAGPYDIRISFQAGSAWSYIGTDIKYVQTQTQPTMNIGWLGLDVALHEIGHTLGLGHEQQSPVGGICWALNGTGSVVIADMARQGWSEAQTRNNILNKYDPASVYATPFDRLSIMEYSIPATWTCNGVAIPGGKVLSEVDKAFIAERYPGRVNPPPTTGVTLTRAQADALIAKAQFSKNAADTVLVALKKALGATQ